MSASSLAEALQSKHSHYEPFIRRAILLTVCGIQAVMQLYFSSVPQLEASFNFLKIQQLYCSESKVGAITGPLVWALGSHCEDTVSPPPSTICVRAAERASLGSPQNHFRQ